jgi:superfamily II RNA helicase
MPVMARFRSDKRRSNNRSNVKSNSAYRNRSGPGPANHKSAENNQRNSTETRYLTQAQKSALDKLLAGIGTPKSQPFVPDAFQLEALEAIESEDVLVTAPTGSGKTWIAREEIRRLLESDRRAWYTSPLKALTNSKYEEFSKEFGQENVGILTGDRKENANAPLIVGTTEIYRNQLFDALRRGEDVQSDLVILDEAHYMADEERGHVWEEAIILSPPRIRLLLLSATIGNAEEFANWISEVRGSKVRVVARPGARPVELRAGFLSPDLQLFPLLNQDGKLNPVIEQMTQNERQSFDHRNRN